MHVKIGRNDPCWCGSMKKYKNCHQSFDEKIEELRSQGHIVPDHSLIKTPEQIAGIKESAKINIAVLDEVASKIKEGMTTEEIDKIVYDTTTKMGGIPAPLIMRVSQRVCAHPSMKKCAMAFLLRRWFSKTAISSM